MREKYDIFSQHIDKRHSVRNQREPGQLVDIHPLSVIIARKGRLNTPAVHPEGMHPEIALRGRIERAKAFKTAQRDLSRQSSSISPASGSAVGNSQRPAYGPPRPLLQIRIFSPNPAIPHTTCIYAPLFTDIYEENTNFYLF